MRQPPRLMPPSRRAPAILAVAGLLVGSAWLRADPPTPASLNLRAAGEARALAERVITQYLDEAGRGSVEGVHRGFEAIRAWIPTRTGGDALTVEQVVQAFASGGGLTGEAGPYADALSRAVVEGARSAGAAGGPLEGGLANLERAITDRVRTAASGFAGAHAGLIQSARWEVIFEALDTGFVPTSTLGPVASAFLRNLGVPAPASAAERMAAGLLAAQTGIVPADSVLAAGVSSGPRPGDDPLNVIHELDLAAAGARARTVGTLPPTAFVTIPVGTKAASPPSTVATPKLHPTLERMLRERPATERVQIVVNLREDFRLPRFPDFNEEGAGGDLVAMAGVAGATGAPPPTVVAGSTSAPDRARVVRQSEALIETIVGQRRPGYEQLRAAWTAPYGVEVLQTYWLVRAMLVEMPLGRVQALSQAPEVIYLQPRFGGERPPQDANAANDIEDGRARVVTDPYFTRFDVDGSRTEFMAILDTGVRATHQLLSRRLLFREDCTGADNACDGAPNPSDHHWNHGTKTASVLIGNDSMGAAFRGATPFYLDSFNVYGGATGLDTAATLLGFQRAIALANRVLVAEIQAPEPETGVIATAADGAYDAGAVVISANGNAGPGASTVNSPGIAHKVIGIGALDVVSNALVPASGRGPATDGRIKPDLMAPTNTEAASNAADNALAVFANTSGAAPYAGAGAALARRFLRGTATSIDPGQVYAFLILGGEKAFPFDDNTGAGLLVMPTGGVARWGKVSVTAGNTVEVPLPVAAGQQRVEAAIWWPERQPETHDDVDLHLIDPAGTSRSFSVSAPGVFEKVRFTASPLATGTWKLQIRGFAVTSGPQDVYWATRVRP